MRSETFTFHGQEMDDGSIYITTDDLPGFRLIATDEASIESEIASALRVFYPIYVAAKAKAEASNRNLLISSVRRTDRTLDLSAEFAFA